MSGDLGELGANRDPFRASLRALTPPPSHTTVQKSLDELKKNADKCLQKDKAADRDLTSAAADIAVFQREKQTRLNTTVFPCILRASQLAVGAQPAALAVAPTPVPGAYPTPAGFLAVSDTPGAPPSGSLPGSVSHSVLFSRGALKMLRARIGEVDGEVGQLRGVMRSLARDDARLAAEAKTLKTAVSRAKAATTELGFLKFGRDVDVRALDEASGALAATLAGVEPDANGEGGVISLKALELLMLSEAATAFSQENDERLRLRSAEDRVLAATAAHTSALDRAAQLAARMAALSSELSGLPAAGLQAIALHGDIGTPMADAAVRIGRVGAGGPASLSSLGTPRAPTVIHTKVREGLRLISAARTSSGADDAVAAAQEAADLNRLSALIEAQAVTIDNLRMRATLLSRKGQSPAPPTFVAADGLLQITSLPMRNGGGGNASIASLQGSQILTQARRVPLIGLNTTTKYTSPSTVGSLIAPTSPSAVRGVFALPLNRKPLDGVVKKK